MEANKEKNTHEDGHVPTGMLSSPHIAYYADKYGIIRNYDADCLGPASYNMRVGRDVLTWRDGERIEFVLDKYEDINKNIRKSIELKPNSLTFLTTIEEFRLPKDIIARFNLKSKWVHLGLLLGTGPIVDPQLHGRLLIPVHNFSSQTVTLHYGDELISVEFTKTLNPDDVIELDDGKTAAYIENKSWELDFQGYRKRIIDKRIESSVQSQFEKISRTVTRYTTINIISGVSVFLMIVAILVSTWNLIHSAHKTADDAYNLVKQYEGSSVDYRAFAFKSNLDDLQMQISELNEYTQQLHSKLSLQSGKSADDIRVERNKLEAKIKSLSLRIEELERELNQRQEIMIKKE